MALKQDDGGPARSTGAFPMPATPEYKMVEPAVDYAKSTNAFPMWDDRNAAARSVEHVDAPVKASFVTPGPQSQGHVADSIKAQRADLGLSADPSGMGDAGYAARPSTVPVLGADVAADAPATAAAEGKPTPPKRK